MDENRNQNRTAVRMTGRDLCGSSDNPRTPPVQDHAHTRAGRGTCRKAGRVRVNIRGRDFFGLMYRTVRYIEAWELTFCPKVIRDAKQALESQRSTA